MSAPEAPSAAQIKAFAPSKYQKAIFETIADPNGPQYIVVEAYAGSGKTTTLVKAATEYVDPKLSILFCAFNKSIATEIGQRVAGHSNVNSSTLHSLGKRALDQHLGAPSQVDKYKQYKLADQYIAKHHPDLIQSRGKDDRIYLYQEGKLLQEAMIDLYNFARLTLTDPHDRHALEQMAIHYQIELDERALVACPTLIAKGEDIARDDHEIDFTDMIYLPVKWGIDMPKFDWVFVDEGQDLNRCQLELSMKCSKSDGRIVWVGDRRQAIYGFAGADNQSIQNIIDRTQAITLPLSISYRCATSILDLAREVTPQIEAREGAPVGKVEIIPADKLADYAKPEDMIVCRLTAPLISECIAFIKRGVKARVEGRDLGKQLNKIVNAVAARENFFFPDFLQHLSMYKMQQVKMLRDKQADDTAVESMIDRCEAVGAVYEGYVTEMGGFTSDQAVQNLTSKIDSLFDEKYPLIKLATVHRCKGLEAKRVFIIAPDKLPLNLGGWQQEQEWNLRYVAVTRAKLELYIVGGPLTPGPHAAGQPQAQPGQLALDPPHRALMEAAEARNLALTEKGNPPDHIQKMIDHVATNIEREETQQLLDQIAQVERISRDGSPIPDDVLRELDAETNNEDMFINFKPAPDAQKGTQEPRKCGSDVNPASFSGGRKTPEMLRQRSLFEKVEKATGGDDPDLEPLDPEYEKGLKVAEGIKQLIEEQQQAKDQQVIDQLNSFQGFDFAKQDPLIEIEAKISTIDNPESKQNALEALETLRGIFG
jgi:DNA helicase II / ATP-dependent DNA helicase PcrA